MLRIWIDYLELGRPRDLRKDFWIAFLIGTATLVAIWLSNVRPTEIIKQLNSLLNVIITAFSILAGFNATSLSIFATSNSPVVRELKKKLIDDDVHSQLEQILAYFSWSVAVQLALLFFSIVFSFIAAYVPVCKFEAHPALSCLAWGATWISVFGILYAINLTLRNVSILYLYLVAESRNSD